MNKIMRGELGLALRQWLDAGVSDNLLYPTQMPSSMRRYLLVDRSCVLYSVWIDLSEGALSSHFPYRGICGIELPRLGYSTGLNTAQRKAMRDAVIEEHISEFLIVRFLRVSQQFDYTIPEFLDDLITFYAHKSIEWLETYLSSRIRLTGELMDYLYASQKSEEGK
jgi:hypothetical protein